MNSRVVKLQDAPNPGGVRLYLAITIDGSMGEWELERAYLVRHLFDGQRLRRRALEEFATAVRTGRLVAFVGSYATQDLGYWSWDDFLDKLAEEAARICEKQGSTLRKQHALKAIETVRASFGGSEAALTGLSVIEYALAYASDKDGALLDELKEFAVKQFILRDLERSRRTNIQRLLEDLAIDRIITLNYDLEFEWELMTNIEEKDKCGDAGHKRDELLDDILGSPLVSRDDCGSLARLLPNGKSVMSDLFSRGRTDRLIEFAVGSPDYEAHVLHLHGRALRRDASTLVISQRDYNNQYRRSGVAKLPFEHALRILFAGNPILFVGIGLKESEITGTLEQFVSDHPNRRQTPAFILWNGPAKNKERDALRFRWLHRYGALALFDDELAELDLRQRRDTALIRMGRSITNAGIAAASMSKRFDWQPSDLRRISDKLARLEIDKCVDIWPTGPDVTDVDPNHPAWKLVEQGGSMHIVIGEPGTGKGRLAKELRAAWLRQKPEGDRRACLVNASFVFETDSVFSLISGLGDGTPACEEGRSRLSALSDFLGAESGREVLLVINGMERFLSPSGAPLSSELDLLLRKLIHLSSVGMEAATIESEEEGAPPVTIYILGTSRVRRYFSALFDQIAPLITHSERRLGTDLTVPGTRYRSVYFDLVAQRFAERGCGEEVLPLGARARIEQSLAGERTALRRAFLSAYLQAAMLRAAKVEHPDLCLDILTTMAFIGSPVEREILFHSPRVRQRIADIRVVKPGQDARDLLHKAVEQLTELALLIPTTTYPGTPATWRRFGLHRSILTQIRDRLSVPLTDAQLSAGFNLSMFVALPADGYSPEGDIHDELGTLVDWLVGAYKDDPLEGYDAIEDDDHQSAWTDDQRGLIRDIMMRRKTSGEMQLSKAWPHVSACLRAALSLLRSYYSTSTLLMVDPSNGVPMRDDDGPLTQHVDRLDRVLHAAVENCRARREAAAALDEHGAGAWLGPAPYYADDLVWLHNERGVVKLAQGDLYGARLAFNEALQLNNEHIEFGEHGHNWRRIMLNQVHVDIERAWLDRAEKRMCQIEESMENELDEPIGDVKAYVLTQYFETHGEQRRAVDPNYQHDIILGVALTMGYRGLILHLQGQLEAAHGLLERATIILDRIGAVRAYAMFQRHLSSLLVAVGDDEAAVRAFRKTVAAGEATKQADVAYHARVAGAGWRRDHAQINHKTAIDKQLRAALRYAEAGDMHRLRIEAGLNLARIKFDSGDFDVALEHAADAMATASRYGLNLRKISLRILIGQILIGRGDPVSGSALVHKAIKNAERVGYHTAIELAQRVLVSFV